MHEDYMLWCYPVQYSMVLLWYVILHYSLCYPATYLSLLQTVLLIPPKTCNPQLLHENYTVADVCVYSQTQSCWVLTSYWEGSSSSSLWSALWEQLPGGRDVQTKQWHGSTSRTNTQISHKEKNSGREGEGYIMSEEVVCQWHWWSASALSACLYMCVCVCLCKNLCVRLSLFTYLHISTFSG